MALLITIYLIGCVVAYVVLRWFILKNDKSHVWTIRNRYAAIKLSLFSVLVVIVVIAIELYEYIIKTNWDKPAKW